MQDNVWKERFFFFYFCTFSEIFFWRFLFKDILKKYFSEYFFCKLETKELKEQLKIFCKKIIAKISGAKFVKKKFSKKFSFLYP